MILYNKNRCYLFGIIILVFYMLPYVLMGEDCYITIHDNLDSSISHIKAIIDNQALFDGNKILPMMEGIKRSLFASPLDIRFLLFALLPIFWAIIVNTFFVKLTAYIGMYFLLDKYIVRKKTHKSFICFSVSLLFALVPFYPDYGISSAGIPMLLFAFLNLKEGKGKMVGFLLVAYYGFYSSLVLSGAFVGFTLLIYMIYQWRINRSMPIRYFAGLVLLGSIYVFTNWNLFVDFLFPSDFVSHRVEFLSHDTAFTVVASLVSILLSSQYHAGSFAAFPILVVFVILFLLRRKEHFQGFFGLIFIMVMISIGLILRWLFPQIIIFQEFQFDRFYFLFPALCFVLLALSLESLFLYRKQVWAMGLLIVTLFSTFWYNPEYRFFVKTMVCRVDSTTPIYSQFYDESLFDTIEKSISSEPRSNYKIVCLGIFPSVLEYNGYHTLDAYVPNYSLAYKHEFREVISEELDKSEELKDYFDDWGSRCYIFSSELGSDYLWGKNRNGIVKDLEIDTKHLKEMGCTYLFSAVEIENYQSLNLEFINSYTTPSSFWNIRIYKIRS